MTTAGLNGARIAIVHEWLDAYAGSEQVFEAIAQEFPAADLYALSRTPNLQLDVGGREIVCTFLNRPRLRDRRGLTLAVMPVAWQAIGRKKYDLVVSSTHAFAHANQLAKPGGSHLAYVHSPARYLWTPDIDRRGASPWLRPAIAGLRKVDLHASKRLSGIAANSSTVADRIRQCWHRDSTVIYPPVRVGFYGDHGIAPTRDYILGVGRWIPYKNFDLVIQAGELANLPVKIAGRGPDKLRLQSLAAAASVPVEIIESPDHAHLRSLYANAACLVFPTVEDFGIVPVEAQAAGTPVVAPRQGGALDTITDHKSGVFVDQLTAEHFALGIKEAQELSASDCVANAASFSRSHFADRLQRWVQAALS